MENIKQLLDNNIEWSAKVNSWNPGFFTRLAKQQSPNFLWIGCSDSRVPANQITGLHPGEIFVHRNIANLVINADLNLLAVLQFSVEILKIRHIIVCGHNGCGGVRAALQKRGEGVLEHWINHIRQTVEYGGYTQQPSQSFDEFVDYICEVNVKEQVKNLSKNPIILNAWEKQHQLHLHGWIYNLEDGLLKDLEITIP
jgi:carbonic anhydrase